MKRLYGSWTSGKETRGLRRCETRCRSQFLATRHATPFSVVIGCLIGKGYAHPSGSRPIYPHNYPVDARINSS